MAGLSRCVDGKPNDRDSKERWCEGVGCIVGVAPSKTAKMAILSLPANGCTTTPLPHNHHTPS